MAVPKLQKLGVGMAVCRQDMLYKDYSGLCHIQIYQRLQWPLLWREPKINKRGFMRPELR